MAPICFFPFSLCSCSNLYHNLWGYCECLGYRAWGLTDFGNCMKAYSGQVLRLDFSPGAAASQQVVSTILTSTLTLSTEAF